MAWNEILTGHLARGMIARLAGKCLYLGVLTKLQNQLRNHEASNLVSILARFPPDSSQKERA